MIAQPSPPPGDEDCVMCNSNDKSQVQKNQDVSDSETSSLETRERYDRELRASSEARGRFLESYGLVVCRHVLPDRDGIFVPTNDGACDHDIAWPSQRD